MSLFGDVLKTVGAALPGPDIFDVGGAIWGTPTRVGIPASSFGNVKTTPNVPAVVVPPVPPVVTRIPGTVMTSQGKTMEGCASTVKTVVTYDCITGQIIKVSPYKRRRRRRRLATSSDIADLQALKSILGKGQALSAYLATEGRGR